MKSQYYLKLMPVNILDVVALGDNELIRYQELVNVCEDARSVCNPDEDLTYRTHVIHTDLCYWIQAGLTARLARAGEHSCSLIGHSMPVYGDAMLKAWRFGYELGGKSKPE